MNFTYRIVEDDGRFVAECVESEAQGEGKTVDDAVASLKESLHVRMFRPDAIAPPEQEPHEKIVLRLATEAHERPDPSGPGEA